MRILVVSDAWTPQVNGVVRTYEHLRHHITEQGSEFKVIGPGDFRYTIPLPGYPEIRLPVMPYWRLKRMIERWEPDCLHIATEGPLGWAARTYARRTGKSFTTSYHTQFPDYTAKRAARFCPFLFHPVRNLAIRIVRRFHAPAESIMVATPSLEDELKSWSFKNKMARLTRGVDIEIFHPPKTPPTLFEDLTKPVALYVGRVAIEKNLEEFLKMPWPGSKVIVGDGPAMNDLKTRYPDAVFAGKKFGHDLAEHYRAADIFVFPSKTDTFGMVLIEAMACGLPVAGYPVTGPKDLITDDLLGATDEDLETAAQKALEAGSGAAARTKRFAHVKKHYTWKKAAEQFIACACSSKNLKHGPKEKF